MSKCSRKNYRVLNICFRLIDGEVINKMAEAAYFHVTERSIQRDINDIRAFWAEELVQGKEFKEVVYDRKRKGYVIKK